MFGLVEFGGLFEDYCGFYIMIFVVYNVGCGSVKKWIDCYGDFCDFKVDVVDWVELIFFFEICNYVQWIMENFQVYCVCFGGGMCLQIEVDLCCGVSSVEQVLLFGYMMICVCLSDCERVSVCVGIVGWCVWLVKFVVVCLQRVLLW